MSILNPNLEGFFESDNRNYILYGGRASSKTYHTAGFCIFLAMNYRVKFMCVRQFQNRIKDSVKTILEEVIYNLGIESQFRITDTELEHLGTGSSFSFFGIQRNLKEIKGIIGIDILWIEEAEDLTEDQWRVLEPTVRQDASRIFIVFNPRFVSDFVYRRFVSNPPPKTIIRKINYIENPFLSKTMLDVIEAAKAEDFDRYLHVYEGEPLQDDDTVIIKRSWILASIDAHIKLGFEPVGRKMVGFDVADSGADKCATVYVHGSVVLGCDMWKASEDELLKSCTRTWTTARELGAEITYDCIGVGASAGAKFGELNSTIDDKHTWSRYQKFNAGGAVFKPDLKYSEHILNKDMFSNIKAQAWWILADRFKATFNAVTKGHDYDPADLISLDANLPHIQLLIDELSTPKREFNKNGQVKVESKDDLKKRDIPSPNLADALVMAYAPIQPKMEVSSDVVRALAHGRPSMAASSSPGTPRNMVEAFKNLGRTR